MAVALITLPRLLPQAASCAGLTSLLLVDTVQIKKLKAAAYKNVHKREKTVSRAYGGSLCGGAVRDRLVTAHPFSASGQQ